MAQDTVSVYLDGDMLVSAREGRHNYMNKLCQAFERAGARVVFRENTLLERIASAGRDGYSLFHMEEPFHDRALTTRRAYVYPFWRIETSARRWEWEVAGTPFDPDAVDPEEAARFTRFWRRRLFGDVETTREGFVYVPLQGLLLDHRSFQTMAPVEMLRRTAEAEPRREILVGLHPKERYLPEEHAALERLEAETPRLQITDAAPEVLLAACDYVVTQNSALAFSGFFFGKPAVLFARIDFHHIAANVAELGVEEALSAARDARPPYERYIHWFLQQMSINAGKEDAPAKILAAVRRRGWKL